MKERSIGEQWDRKRKILLWTLPVAILIGGVATPLFTDYTLSKQHEERNGLYKKVSDIADVNNDGKLDINERTAVYETLGVDYVPSLRRLTDDQMKQYIENNK